MFFYSTLAHYLQGKYQAFTSDFVTLRGKDRPFLQLTDDEQLIKEYNFLIKRSKGVYEIGFPWVQINEWNTTKTLSQLISLENNKQETVSFLLQDEVLDKTQLNNDEEIANKLQEELGKKSDRITAETINIFIGLFSSLSNNYQQKKVSPLKLFDSLTQLSQDDARLPLVLALNKRYELRHKLELIAPKLRSQLNRVAEMMPLTHIQEMDAYCLRDYIRRPGKDAIEKAGARQELMGIQRYQAYQDYLQRRTDKEKLWGFRQNLLIDVITILWVAALLNFQGSYLQPLAQIEILDTPIEGRYLEDKQELKVFCFLQTAVFTFSILQNIPPKKGDLQINITMQRITKNKPEIFEFNWNIWIFWYQPDDDILTSIQQNTGEDFPICFYLYHSPQKEEINYTDKDIEIIQIPHPFDENLEAGVKLLTEKICYWLEDWK